VRSTKGFFSAIELFSGTPKECFLALFCYWWKDGDTAVRLASGTGKLLSMTQITISGLIPGR